MVILASGAFELGGFNKVVPVQVFPRHLHKALQISFLRLVGRLKIPQGPTLILISIIVGLITGLGSVAFIRLLQLTTWLFFEKGRMALSRLGDFYVILLPILGGAIVGPLISLFAQETKGHGVPEVMTAITLRGGRIRNRVAFVKILASALTIGSGGSAGREGPMIQIGSGVGSTVGQFLKMSDERIITLVACGAAGGVAATFNAPIAGAMFALEILVGRFTLDFSMIVLSAVTSAIVSRAMLGNFPAFKVPPYDLISEKEMLFYIILGLLAAGAATAFVRALYTLEDLFDGWKFPDPLKPAVGGALVGLMGFFLPQLFGTGFPAMEATLKTKLPFTLLLLLIPMKILATSVTLASGGSGGVFAPALFIGAMLGGAYGFIVHHLFPNFTASYGAYALVGMGAVFGAAAQAPLTSIIILFEMTNDYRIILPLMTATVISTFLYRAVNEESIYTLKLKKRGISYRAGQDMDLMTSIQVREALTHRWISVGEGATVKELLELMHKTDHEWFPIVNKDGELVGVVTAQDVREAIERGELSAKVTDYATKDVIVAYPDESLREVLMRFGVRDIGHLPVVQRGNPRRVVGIISRRHAIMAYNRALREKIRLGKPMG